MEIESYGYTTADIDYFWGKTKTDKQESAVAFSDFTLPQFKRAGYRVAITKAQTSSGLYQINKEKTMYTDNFRRICSLIF